MIGLLTLDIHLPDAHSLKGKRFVIQSLKDRLRRFNVSVAELDHQDLWQRSVIGIVSISSDHRQLETALQHIEREAASILGRGLVSTQTEFL
ncbi:MAG: DUF503 domain-containing protein [Acidobacteria bacterium]|nr:DUF503 domain-containing protein [Acidobacteriota bacterium]